MATSAFPTVVPPFRRSLPPYTEAVYREGALLANNPVIEAIAEVNKLWPGRAVGCVHSIGFGGGDGTDRRPEYEKSRHNLVHNLTAVANTIADVDQHDRHARQVLAMRHPWALYRRLQLPLTDMPTFLAQRPGYDEADARVQRFLPNSDIYQGMVRDLATARRGTIATRTNSSIGAAVASYQTATTNSSIGSAVASYQTAKTNSSIGFTGLHSSTPGLHRSPSSTPPEDGLPSLPENGPRQAHVQTEVQL